MSHDLEPSPSTLLVFTLGAQREQRRRRLLPGSMAPEERALHQGCLDGALEAGRANACRLQVCSPAALALPADCDRLAQPGRDFGERLASAMGRARIGASVPLVVVGSDVPDLSSSHVAQALDLLAGRPQRVVLGPSRDGGVFLLASHGPMEECFGAVRWCSRTTRRTLVRALEQAGWEVVLLDPLGDLDLRSDLERWLARGWKGAHALAPLASRIRHALADLRRPQPQWWVLPTRSLANPATAGRAPPA